MHVVLSDDQKAKQDEFRAFAEQNLAKRAADFDKREAIPQQLLRSLGERGLLGSHLPGDLGGPGLDMTTYGLLHQEIGRVCSNVRSFLTVHDMVSHAIAKVGRKEQQDEHLPKLLAGESLAAFALTEPGVGSDAAAVETTAMVDGDILELTGGKKWISFGQVADVFLVFARVAGRGDIAAILVPATAEGLEIEPMGGLLGLRGCMLAELRFDKCRLPAEALLGSAKVEGNLVTSIALNHGRYSVAWGCVGILQACVDASYHYARERQQYGAALIKHQLIGKMLSDMLVDSRAARLLCLEAGYLWDQGSPAGVPATLCAKYYASRAANRVARDAVQIHGANGLTSDYAVERFYRDARVMEIIEGSSEMQQIMIPKFGPAAFSDFGQSGR